MSASEDSRRKRRRQSSEDVLPVAKRVAVASRTNMNSPVRSTSYSSAATEETMDSWAEDNLDDSIFDQDNEAMSRAYAGMDLVSSDLDDELIRAVRSPSLSRETRALSVERPEPVTARSVGRLFREFQRGREELADDFPGLTDEVVRMVRRTCREYGITGTSKPKLMSVDALMVRGTRKGEDVVVLVKRANDVREPFLLNMLQGVPGIIRLYGFATTDLITLVEEALPPSFAKYPQTTAKLRLFVLCMLDTLRQLHARGVVHGDLSPGNVAWCPDRAFPWVIFDFDCSMITMATAADEKLPYGTPSYEAPEAGALAFEKRLAPGLDLFSMGQIATTHFTDSVYKALPACVSHVLEEIRAEKPSARGTALGHLRYLAAELAGVRLTPLERSILDNAVLPQCEM